MRILPLILLLIAIPLTAQAQLRAVATGVTWAEPISPTETLVFDANNDVSLLNLTTGGQSPWAPDWNWDADGWDEIGPYLDITVSPDGNWLYVLRWVSMVTDDDPELAALFAQDVVAVILCKPDGSDARCVAISQSVGGGPQFEFTADSSRLVGQPLELCEPTRAAYEEYLDNLWEPQMEEFNFIEVATGKRGWAGELDISDGFYKCPYSDYFISDSEGGQPFGNFRTGMLDGDYSFLEEEWGWNWFCTWVLPDAVLYSDNEKYGLIYVDGKRKKIEGPRYEMACWLPDNTFIFTDSIGQAFHGTIDWDTNTFDLSHDIQVLTGWGYNFLEPLPDSSGVLIGDDDGMLYVLPLAEN